MTNISLTIKDRQTIKGMPVYAVMDSTDKVHIMTKDKLLEYLKKGYILTNAVLTSDKRIYIVNDKNNKQVDTPITEKFKLFSLTELAANNNSCVILKVKPDAEDKLIMLGPFRGSEKMFRVSKGYDPTYTIFRKDGTQFSWSDNTLVTDQVICMGKLIRECIEKDYHIRLR